MEVALQTMAGYDETLHLARWCETEGVAALSVADHYLSGPDLESAALDQLVVLGGIARQTTTLQLATLVSPLTFRHPAVHLKAAVTLDEMSGGRFSLGIGAGWMQEEHDAFGLELPAMPERFERLEETLGYLRAALSGESMGFEGNHYRLGPFTPQPSPTRLRIITGGVGAKRTPDLAGRYADEFNLAAGEVPWRPRIERALRAAADAGRDPSSLAISAAFPPLTGRDEVDYRDRLNQWAASRGQTAEELEQRLASLNIPHGPVDRLTEGLSDLAGHGVGRVYLQLGSDPDLHQVQLAMAAASTL
jgi:alkanesulfonate monooxygenase SsuD/methylene tetrahydromethanopterin reductase-like flavin-dependent oxidoreductase (luciferase family)